MILSLTHSLTNKKTMTITMTTKMTETILRLATFETLITILTIENLIMTVILTWQLRVTLDSIYHSCNVLLNNFRYVHVHWSFKSFCILILLTSWNICKSLLIQFCSKFLISLGFQKDKLQEINLFLCKSCSAIFEQKLRMKCSFFQSISLFWV